MTDEEYEQHLKTLAENAYKQGYIDGQIQVYQDMRKHLEAKHEIRDDDLPKPAA